MRTAVFVEETCLVTIRAQIARDSSVELCRYKGKPVAAVGKHKLERGIYMIVSNGPMLIEGVRGEVATQGGNKDEWPEPKPNVLALEPGATPVEIQRFLTIAAGLSPRRPRRSA